MPREADVSLAGHCMAIRQLPPWSRSTVSSDSTVTPRPGRQVRSDACLLKSPDDKVPWDPSLGDQIALGVKTRDQPHHRFDMKPEKGDGADHALDSRS